MDLPISVVHADPRTGEIAEADMVYDTDTGQYVTVGDDKAVSPEVIEFLGAITGMSHEELLDVASRATPDLLTGLGLVDEEGQP